MQIAPLLLVTTSLITPAPAQPGPSVDLFRPDLMKNITLEAVQQPRQNPITQSNPNTQDPTHQFGLGAALTMTNRGVGGSMRYWFGDHVGVTLQASWYKSGGYRAYSITGVNADIPTGHTYQVMPSLILLFGQTDPTKVVSLRPYVGGGASYASSSRPVTTLTGPTSSTVSLYRTSGIGQVGFGGIELSFLDYPSLTISNEIAYYRLPVKLGNRTAVDGVNYQVAVHFYLK
jgi:outer membrane protein W